MERKLKMLVYFVQGLFGSCENPKEQVWQIPVRRDTSVAGHVLEQENGLNDLKVSSSTVYL